MPKRVPPEEKPFRPVENALVQRVMGEVTPDEDEAEKPHAARPKKAKRARPAGEPAQVLEMERPEPAEAAKPESASAAPRRKPIERFQLTHEEKTELNDFANRLSAALGTNVKTSNVHRCFQVLWRNATREILKRADQNRGQLYRPSNENHVATAEFEYRLAKIISSGLRDAPPLREG